MSTSGLAAWQLAFEVSPIIFTGGIATAQGGAIPIISLLSPNITGVTATENGLIVATDSGSTAYNTDTLNSVFARFYPAPGSTLLSAAIGQYPFANQAIAGNAIISQPTNVSMMMVCPAGNAGGYGAKQTTMTQLANSCNQHNSLGGTYSVITPAFIYLNAILTAIQCVDGGPSKQPQFQYRWDFNLPLVSLAALQQAQNGLMTKLSQGTQISGTPTWIGGAGLPVGNAPNLVTQSVIPSAIPQNPPQPFAGNMGF
jgi:hypothetical protein